jgi:putrescine aminotransferase
MDAAEVYARHARYISPALVELLHTLGYEKIFPRAQGCFLYDETGRPYVDMISGFGSVNLGYNHPEIIAALQEALAASPPSFLHVAPPVEAGLLAEALAARLGHGLEISFFGNSGAEAIEGALKLAFSATRRTRALYCHRSYHGLTLGALSVTGSESLRKYFPSLPGCEEVVFGSLEGVEEKLRTRNYAAFVVEPWLIEGGIVEAPSSYLRDLSRLCTQYGTALIVDEVQTGLGRTGSLFAFQEMGVSPDIVAYAKGFSGGLLPIGGFTTSREWYQRAYPGAGSYGRHASTFGGNALSCAVARKTLSLVDEALCARVRRAGESLGRGLRGLGSPLVSGVRGRGLLFGVSLQGPPLRVWERVASLGLSKTLSKRLLGHWVAVRLLEEGFVTETTTHDEATLRVEPSLLIEDAQLEGFVQALGRVLHENERFLQFVRGAGGRLLQQWSRR